MIGLFWAFVIGLLFDSMWLGLGVLVAIEGGLILATFLYRR